jgi:hypothetical protein
VRGSCVGSSGLSSLFGSPVRGKRANPVVDYRMKHEGILRRHGYNQRDSPRARHAAIASALREWRDPLGLLRHMNLIQTRSRNRATNREGLRNMASDIRWLGAQFGYEGFAKGRQLKLLRGARAPL